MLRPFTNWPASISVQDRADLTARAAAAYREGVAPAFKALRDFLVSSSMGVVHFMAQIPYGIGAFYLGRLGTTIGWGANIGMALIVASGLGFLTGEWKGASKKTSHMLYYAIAILIGAIVVLASANTFA
jgi:hypothetical protein